MNDPAELMLALQRWLDSLPRPSADWQKRRVQAQREAEAEREYQRLAAWLESSDQRWWNDQLQRIEGL